MYRFHGKSSLTVRRHSHEFCRVERRSIHHWATWLTTRQSKATRRHDSGCYRSIACRATGAKVSRMRKQFLDCEPVANEFTAQEREEMQQHKSALLDLGRE